MANKNKDIYNKYMKEYILNRYHRRMQEALEFLGNKCIKCGRTESLQLDHIFPTSKIKTISKIWSYSDEIFWEEVKKCQILCRDCHIEKTILELGKKIAKGTHGTLSSYRYCKCSICKKAMSDWNKEYSRKRRERKNV
jgi:hypothetical protein